MRSVLSKILVVTVALGANIGMVYAAEPETTAQRDSVRYRARPAYDAVGIRAGGFTVFPQASVAETYDDNIYATDVNETDDFITTLATSVLVSSNWSRHSLNFLAGLSDDLYADHTDENRFNWNVGFDGNLDITRDTTLGGGASYRQLHEDRGDPNSPAAASEPTPYTLASADLNFQQKFNRLFARVSGGVDDYDYDDILSTTGVNIDQDNRDRTETFEALRFGYEVTPDTNLFLEGTINQRSYDQTPPAVPLDRSSDGYSVVGGSEFRLSNLAQGEVYLGYQEQTYDDARLSNVSGVSYGANVEWYVTGLTTVTFDASSKVAETTTVGASGYLQQDVGVRVDHELMRNILVNGSVGYGTDEYEGVSRTDDTLRAGLGLDYLLNRNFTFGVGYDYTDKDSDLAGRDYKKNVVGLTLTGKL